MLGKERGRAHDLARLAVAALRHILCDPGFLDGMVASRAQPFNGCDAVFVGAAHGESARANGDAVKMNGAGPADANPAAVFGATEAPFVANHP